jgi:predicted phosphodiesterase
MADDKHATLHTRDDGTFHILQLTDFHDDIAEESTQRTHAEVRGLVERYSPDLLAITGDIWGGDTQPEKAATFMQRSLDLFASQRTPWFFTWGNHDYAVDFDAAQARIRATPSAVAPPGDGRGNFRITLCDRSNGDVQWDLFILNSGLTWELPGDIAWFQEESARLVQNRGGITPALAFFHIPLVQYEEARQAGTIVGTGPELADAWGDDGTVFEALQQAGNVRACFVGHSHSNDYYAELDGIVLAYGRCTGYGGYGGDELKRGGKLISIDTRARAFSFRTVFADGSAWPEGDYASGD